jgi:hypothetical protein
MANACGSSTAFSGSSRAGSRTCRAQRARYGFDPVQRLCILRTQLRELSPAGLTGCSAIERPARHTDRSWCRSGDPSVTPVIDPVPDAFGASATKE